MSGVLREPIELVKTFRSIADRWRLEAGMHSSVRKMVVHPAYQAIIAMGEPAIPLILTVLRDRPDHWFEAPRPIAGESPVPPQAKGNLEPVARAWLDWGRAKGCID